MESREPQSVGVEWRLLGATGLDLEYRAGTGASGGLPHIVGYAAVFDSPTKIEGLFSSYTEIVRPGAFARTIREDDIRALFNHDPSLVLGRSHPKAPGAGRATLLLSEDRHGLKMDITPPETQLGRDVVEMVRRGDVSGASFGFLPRQQRWTRDEAGNPVQRDVLEARLLDVSPVTFPAYPDTEVNARAAAWARRGLLQGVEALDEGERELLRRLLERAERETRAGRPPGYARGGPTRQEDEPLTLRRRRLAAAFPDLETAGTEEEQG